MGTFLLRLEGVNLFNFVLDTRKLPVIRGGSALLLEAPELVKVDLDEALGLRLESISVGASSGLFRFEGDQADADHVVQHIESFLRTHEELRHATFVVDATPETGSFLESQERVLAANRWRQMQSLSTDIPKPATVAADRVACEFDGVRPAVHPLDGDSDRLSESVRVRREKGNTKGRQEFYRTRSGYDPIRFAKFVQDFEGIAKSPPPSVPKNLADKIAVIYLDGNKFGKRQMEAADSVGGHKLSEWDSKLRGLRTDLLAAQLRSMIDGGEEWKHDGALRFETLLWGGDELIWITPAWQGLSTLRLFYEHTASWTDHAGAPLNHGGGLVFCHSKAPIHRITALAGELADIAKRTTTDNAFAYQVLESFDHVGGSLEAHLATRRPDGFGEEAHVLTASRMKGFAAIKHKLERDEFPKRRLFATVRNLLDSDKTQTGKQDLAALKENPKFKDHLQGLDDMGFVHLLELWDYLWEGRQDAAAQG